MGGQHEEGAGKLRTLPPHRHRPFLHGLEQGRLGFGRGPVDFIGQNQVGKHRAGFEFEAIVLTGILDNDGGPDDVGGHEVGGELNARSGQRKGSGQTSDQQGLAQARHPLEKHVPLAQKGNKGEVHHRFLAHDGPAQLLTYRLQRLNSGRDLLFLVHGETSWVSVRK